MGSSQEPHDAGTPAPLQNTGMPVPHQSKPNRKLPPWLTKGPFPTILGYAIAAASLVWVLSKFSFAELSEHLRTLDWRFVALAIAFEVATYFVDAWRWMILLEPAGAPTFGACLQSVFVGLFANDVLPARAGEVIRCILLSYKTEVHLSQSITSTVVLRIMDGLWLVIIYLAITFRISTHRAVNDVMWAFGGGAVTLAALLLFALFRRQHAKDFAHARSETGRFVRFLEDIHRLGHWRELGMTMAVGGLFWILQLLAIGAIASADRFEFDLSQLAFLMVVKTVGTIVQLAPANMGTSQATMVYALERMFTEPSEARILAQITFAFLTLPLIAGGAIAVAAAGVRLEDLRKHAHQAHRPGHQHIPS
jgi:uncharacterized protein (TIRG00374 family)